MPKHNAIRIGETHDSKHGLFTVIELAEKNGYRSKFKIRFHNTGGEAIVESSRIRNGNVHDHFAPSIAGVGYLGNARRKGNEKIHDLWRAMIHRCYSPKYKAYKDYGAKGVYVDERWHSFENFLNDITSLEGWDAELFHKGEIFLDKDKYSFAEEKRYSPETCAWISRQENNEIESMQRNIGKMKPFIAISPDGARYETINVNKFAKENGLTPQRVHDCLNGLLKQTKGWTFERIGD